jgi:hypothetical protein
LIIITSAAYVDAELQSEFGRLPHAFLPVGNRRLFERQVKLLSTNFPNESIYLSLPDDFVPAKRDAHRLESLGITLVFVPASLSLTESLLYVINTVANYADGVRLLHGDTLFTSVPKHWDCVTVAESFDDYAWHIVDSSQSAPLVWSGFFAFRAIGAFARSLVASRGHFDVAIAAYAKSNPLENVLSQGWQDFGHVNTFFRSRAQITTQRSFNHLQIRDHRVRKSGDQPKKISAEANWFVELPECLRDYAPQILRYGDDAEHGYSYELEYLCFAPLNELYVHGANPVPFWLRLFKHMHKWFESSQKACALSDDALNQVKQNAHILLVNKTRERMASYLDTAGVSGNAAVTINGISLPSLLDVIDTCLSRTALEAVVPGVLHGDLCFSNILFDSRADRIKLIDPRGMSYTGERFILGDLRYDLAKLTHSVCGFYDFIIAGAFEIDNRSGLDFELNLHLDDRVEQVSRQFLDLPMLGILTPRAVMPQVVLLFLSMLPLHADQPTRQRALLANGLRLFSEMEQL